MIIYYHNRITASETLMVLGKKQQSHSVCDL